MAAKEQGNIAGPSSMEAFAFVQELAKEMSSGKIEIPAFPDVAVRIRKVLADENSDAGQIARVVGADPAMAARLLQMANSAALNPSGVRITELKSAIARLGISNVRTTSLAYAMDQIRNAAALQPIRKPLNELWEHSIRVAAMALVTARRWTKVNPDKALLAGLMHGMGRVYILTRAIKHPALFADSTAYQQIVRDWNTAIAKAVLESWDIAADIVDAVANYEDTDRATAGPADLTDVLDVASLLVSCRGEREQLELHVQQSAACRRMGLSAETCEAVMKEVAGELSGLRQALGG